MTKEIKIGILVALAVVIFFAGFYYLKGNGLFNNDNTYYAHYDNIAGLQPSAPVTIRGMMVGRVSDIGLDAAHKGIRLALTVDDEYALPRGTVARLHAADLMGSKAIELELGPGTQSLEDGAILPTATEAGQIEGLTQDLQPILQNVKRITLHLDTLLVGVNQVFNLETRQRLNHAVASLDATLENFNLVSRNLQSKNAALARTIDNAEKTTAMLAGNRANIDATLNNLNETSVKLRNAPVEETVRELQETAANIKSLIRRIETGDGSLGRLINDKALYENLNASAKEFSNLAEDLRKHPSRYINVNIFGRRVQTVQP